MQAVCVSCGEDVHGKQHILIVKTLFMSAFVCVERSITTTVRKNSIFTCNGCSEQVKEGTEHTMVTPIESEIRTWDKNSVIIEGITEIGRKPCGKLHREQCDCCRTPQPMLHDVICLLREEKRRERRKGVPVHVERRRLVLKLYGARRMRRDQGQYTARNWR